MFRVVRRGGRIAISDIVSDEERRSLANAQPCATRARRRAWTMTWQICRERTVASRAAIAV